MKIRLPIRASDDLKWEKELQLAKGAEKIVWEFDFVLEKPLEDEMQFQALALAAQTFAEELHSEKTEKIVLYRGSADFSKGFHWTERQEASWEEWKRERPQAREEHLKRLFCADAFANYFQMLAHRLPDEAPVVLVFSEEGCGTRAEREQLLSRERFEHFILQREVADASSIAVCFPEEAQCSGEILEKMDRLFERIEGPFRVIAEPFLTEEWGGIDVLYVLSEALSSRGERMLKGFCAAGGEVIKI